MYKILHVIGARPHFMKLAPVYKTLRKDGAFSQVVVHTGQHYDHAMSDAFLEEFELNPPDHNLGVGSESPVRQIAQIMNGLDQVTRMEQPDMIYVYGDTNSTAAGAIAAVKSNIPLAHVEAGLREFDKRIPEEINKLITDAVADIYFCPTQTAVNNLAAQGIVHNVHRVGDTVLDWLEMESHKFNSDESLARFRLKPDGYYLVTCHRAANTDDANNLQAICSALEQLQLPVLFPVHPRTRRALEDHDIDLSRSEHIRLVEPTGFWSTQSLIRNARAVLTDSGGVIREAYYHQAPCVILDTQTEWIEVVHEGWATVTGPDANGILRAIDHLVKPAEHGKVLGEGGASLQIARITKSFLDETH